MNVRPDNVLASLPLSGFMMQNQDPPPNDPNLEASQVTRQTGREPFTFKGENTGDQLLSFWQWSSSNLLDNALRGVLAEYIVGTALNATDGVRVEWDAYDFHIPDGPRVEVKSSAYLQTWKQKAYSTISFDIAPKRTYDYETNAYSSDSLRNADVYVFCLFTHRELASANPLQLDQWEFYCINSSRLNDELGPQKRLSLSRLLALKPSRALYPELKAAVEQVWQER